MYWKNRPNVGRKSKGQKGEFFFKTKSPSDPAFALTDNKIAVTIIIAKFLNIFKFIIYKFI